ncbi:hypothetical protein G9A89_014089 [Geosiphon pyriformis]|nr:hypothetical protein G9A89_014089 [Geosiphon pyriformis]
MSKTKRQKELINEQLLGDIWNSHQGRASPNFQPLNIPPAPVRSLSNPVPLSPPFPIQDRKSSLASSTSSTTNSGWEPLPLSVHAPMPRKESVTTLHNNQRSAIYLKMDGLDNFQFASSQTKLKPNKVPPRLGGSLRSSELEPPQRSPSPLYTPIPSPTGGSSHTKRKKSRDEKDLSFLSIFFGTSTSRPASPNFDNGGQSENNSNTRSSNNNSNNNNNNNNSGGRSVSPGGIGNVEKARGHSRGHARKLSAGNVKSGLALPEIDEPRRKSFDSFHPNDSSSNSDNNNSMTTGYEYSRPPLEIAPFAYESTDTLVDPRKGIVNTISSSVDSRPLHHKGGIHRRTKSSDSDHFQLTIDNLSSSTLVSNIPPVKEKKTIFSRFGRKKSKDNEKISEASSRKNSDSDSTRHGTSIHTPTYERDDPFGSYSGNTSSNRSTSKNDHHHHWVKVSMKRKDSFKGKKGNALDGLALDLDLKDMNGIVNYEHHDAASILNGSHDDYSKDTTLFNADCREFSHVGGNEGWAPPESWAVLKPGSDDQHFDEEGEDFFEDAEKLEHSKRLFCIRIFRPDATFGTVNCDLNTTTSELCHMLSKKFFIQDISKYSLYVKRHNLERVLAPQERPLLLQKKWLEQAGYAKNDKLEDLGREDNSYLMRFTFREATVPTRFEKEETLISFKQVDLKARNLQTIPIFLYRYAFAIRSLDISQNLMLDLPTDFIQSCEQLRELYLSQNDLDRVPQSVRVAQLLSKLNLSSNRLRELEHARLDSITGLENLQLGNNQLQKLPQHFARMSSLSSLNISNNDFTTFPLIICELIKLEELDISFNHIVTLPQEIENLIFLERFIAIGNKITGALPSSFGKLGKLRHLNLSHNEIQNIEILTECQNLEYLFLESNNVSIVNITTNSFKEIQLSQNHLTQFSLSGTSRTLTHLSLTLSKLTTLPDPLFEHLLSLERLDLCYNQLVSIPNTISALQQLTHFNCTNNLLTELPQEIGRLTSLRSLDVHNNNISTLPKELWLCQNLVTINASSNLLEHFPPPYSSSATPSISPSSPAPPSTSPSTGPIPPAFLSNGPGDTSPTLSTRSQASLVPPLAQSLRALYLGDNQLRNDIFAVISVFTELRILNLSFNDLDEVPRGSVISSHLMELYLSGNEFGALPDEIDALTSLRVLHVNGNKLQTLPAELSKIRKLLVLDVGSNALKYNIANWQFDWNWNWNIELKYLNLSGNKRFEIKPIHLHEAKTIRERNLAAFDSLSKLRVLGLMDVTLLNLTVPDEADDRRVRTSGSEVNSMAYGMADTLGQLEHLSTWEAVIPKFRNRDDECLFGIFDSRVGSYQGGRVTKYLHDWFPFHFTSELDKLKEDGTIEDALRRSFLSLNKELGAKVFNSNLEVEFTRESDAGFSLGIDDNKSGASGLVVYIKGTTLYVANVGDIVAVISRNGGDASPIAKKHSPMESAEISRIRKSGGFISPDGLVNGELKVTRSFGHFHLMPFVNANPTVRVVHLEEQVEFVIIATRGLWDRLSYQTAVDIAKTEREDLMRAAQKLRDFAIAHGAEDNIMVMIIGVEDIFDRRTRRWEGKKIDGMGIDVGATVYYGRGRRGRGKEEMPSDSTIARLQKEIPPPTGQIALVFTDIKNSTFLWETIPTAMRHAIKQHNSIMRRQLRNIGGYEVKTEGDAFMVSFPTVAAALLWCFTVQLQLLQADWPTEVLVSNDGKEVYGGHESELIYRGLSVRMGIHWGSPVCEIDPITRRMDYFGPMVNRAARICNAADGGQICVSADVESEIGLLDIIMEHDSTLLAGRKNSQEPDGDAALAAAAAAAAVAIEINNGRAITPNGGHPNSGTIGGDKTVLSLRKMGFVVKKIGETKLKGLENPEELSLVYPEALKGRLEEDQAKMKQRNSVIPEKIYEPSTQILDPSSVRTLGYLCLRLERVASGNVKTRSSRNSRTDYLTGLLTFHVKDNADDEELLRITESLITRIENAISTLYLNKVGRYAKMLGDAFSTDTDHILKALQMYAQAMGVSI